MKINADMCFVLHHMNVSMQHRVLLIVVERGIMATTRKSDLFVRGKQRVSGDVAQLKGGLYYKNLDKVTSQPA